MGNLPQEADDEALRALFSQVGPVATVRIVTDHVTQKRKGFGFVEFADDESALEAVKTLADINFQGRALRLGLAEQETRDPAAAAGIPGAGRPPKRAKTSAPGLPAQPQCQGGGGAIGQIVGRTSRDRLCALVQQARAFAAAQPQQARHLLLSQPQLHVALRLALDRLYAPHTSAEAPSPSCIAAPKPRALQTRCPQPMAPPFHQWPRPAGLDEHQMMLLEQVRGLTSEQLATLTPVERQQIETLRGSSRGDVRPG